VGDGHAPPEDTDRDLVLSRSTLVWYTSAVPRHSRRRRRALRRTVLVALPTAVFVALVPFGATPVSAPMADVQQAVSAVGPRGQTARIHPLEPDRNLRVQPAPHALPPSLLTGYRWPLRKGRITLPFGVTGWGSRIVDGQHFHDGLDLATFCGDRIVAAHDGRVLAAGRQYDRYIGWIGDLEPYFRRLDRKQLWQTLPIVVVIDDGNGYRSIYAHFGRIVVKRGQTVKAGQLLGYEGATGHATGCHLHYGLFSPLETAQFGLDPDVARRMKLPRAEIARIDPLLVLPERKASKPRAVDDASSATGHDAGTQPTSGIDRR
jgi:murein DD-endopeptidase MepM/ murein hydrolase activator NlpD